MIAELVGIRIHPPAIGDPAPVEACRAPPRPREGLFPHVPPGKQVPAQRNNLEQHDSLLLHRQEGPRGTIPGAAAAAGLEAPPHTGHCQKQNYNAHHSDREFQPG
ncbi:hypothetical protein AAFF_G00039380 [Aldrovandia affinis]|uniref:Uncharacterized protein n=1 Tax=Aldrovandia affinis TaxID=143900 RepID=A0AAD7S3C4_9TELE|nr:hypothetical protein AAFF_G00039380 [Aldrovandia affinis]